MKISSCGKFSTKAPRQPTRASISPTSSCASSIRKQSYIWFCFQLLQQTWLSHLSTSYSEAYNSIYFRELGQSSWLPSICKSLKKRTRHHSDICHLRYRHRIHRRGQPHLRWFWWSYAPNVRAGFVHWPYYSRLNATHVVVRAKEAFSILFK